MRMTLGLVALGLAFVASAGAESLTYEQAQKIAAKENKPVLVDFYATWCGPCKAFTKAAETDADVRKALGNVVLCKLDAEKEGKAFAEEQQVKGYPTFVLMNAKGATYDRWAGYSEEFFLERMGEGLADKTTIDQKVARMHKQPTPGDALKLVRYHESRGEYDQAVEMINQAIVLGPEKDLSFDRFELLAAAYLRTDSKMWNDASAAADVVVAHGKATPEELVQLYQRMRSISQKAERPELAKKFLEPAMNATKDAKDEELADANRDLQIDYALYVANDPEKAVTLKRATLPEGWMDSASQLNSFAWWCFENGVNLREAETLARKGIEVAAPGSERAMVLDTAAEICNARGRCDDAVELIRQAMAEDPNSKHYPKQLTRFEEIRAQNAN